MLWNEEYVRSGVATFHSSICCNVSDEVQGNWRRVLMFHWCSFDLKNLFAWNEVWLTAPLYVSIHHCTCRMFLCVSTRIIDNELFGLSTSSLRLLCVRMSCLLAHIIVILDDRLADQTIQAAVGDTNLHLFADALPQKTSVESGGPVETVATAGSGNKQQHQHRKRKERHESFNSRSQERKVIRYRWCVLFHVAIARVIAQLSSSLDQWMCDEWGLKLAQLEPEILLLLQYKLYGLELPVIY
jgi:hypothetical protein